MTARTFSGGVGSREENARAFPRFNEAREGSSPRRNRAEGFGQAFRASRAREMALEYGVIVALLALAITASVLDLGKTAGITRISGLLAAAPPAEVTGSIKLRSGAGRPDQPLQRPAQIPVDRDGTAARAIDMNMDEVPLRGSF